ncbi:ABC transporter permease [bacterium]|nr:ABC transporter permease [bacterium]
MTENSIKQIPAHIYSPQGVQVGGISGRFITDKLMLGELIGARELIIRLFIRDFSAKYKQSVLGMLWAVLLPLITVTIFVFINHAGVFNTKNINMPYPLYVLIGTTFFNFFNAGIVACTNSIIQASQMLTKINFPKITLVISAAMQGFVDFAVRIILLMIAFVIFSYKPNYMGLALSLLCLIPYFLFMLGLGFMLALLTGIMRDIMTIVNFGCMGLMMLSPILYPIEQDSLLGKLNRFNPINYFVNFPRDIIMDGKSDLLIGFTIMSVSSLIFFYICWRFFYLAQTKITERV